MNYVSFSLFLIIIPNFSSLATTTVAEPTEFWSSEDKFPTYPFYFHAKVRKKISTEHVPVSSPGRMKEMTVHSNQEVHEQKGYVDSSDLEPFLGSPDLERSEFGQSAQKEGRTVEVRVDPSKILTFASNHMYDRGAHEHGIYAARNRINCPHVGMNSFSEEGTAAHGAKSKTKTAKAYMECIKQKYFGTSPLPPQIFPHPAQSRRQVMKMGSMTNFMSEFRNEFNR